MTIMVIEAMTRRYLSLVLNVLVLVVAGTTLFAVVQFARGDLPNLMRLIVPPATVESDGPLAVLQWIPELFAWLGSILLYVGGGFILAMALNQLATIVEFGWVQYRAEMKAATADYDKYVATEKARAARRRLREVARAKREPSGFGAVIFGVIVGWFFFH